MTVVGVLLVVLAALLLVAVLVGGSDQVLTLDLGLFDVTTSTLGVFLIGVATVLVLVSGLELLRNGLRRSIRHRRELKRARAVVADHERGERAHTRPADSDAAHDTAAPGHGDGGVPPGKGESTPREH